MTEPFVALDPDQQLGYLLARVAAQLERPWSASLKAKGINPRQFSMLSLLARDATISQAELARRVLITPQSVSESLVGLEDAGLIMRGEIEPGHPARLRLTATGRKLLTRAWPEVERTNREGFAMLTAAERAELSRLLKKVLGAP